MISIRTAKADDLIHLQQCNLSCLPENYQQKYYLYHLLTWPQLSFVAEDVQTRKIVGYVLAKLEDEEQDTNSSGAGGNAKITPPHGHITSLAVMKNYRRMGIAYKLMHQSNIAMANSFNVDQVTLHVRESNRSALHLYRDSLGFEVMDIEKKYYGDGEVLY